MLRKIKPLMIKIGFAILGLLLIGRGAASIFEGSLQSKGIDGRLAFGPALIFAGILIMYIYLFRKPEKK